MSLTRFRVDYYNVMTNLLHTSVDVVAPDEESATRRANQRFGNLNHEDATGEFYRSAVTPLGTVADDASDDASGEDVPEASPVAPEAVPVTLADIAAGTPVAPPAPDTPVEGESKAAAKARLQAELDALNNEG